jgi:hypothetical protein
LEGSVTVFFGDGEMLRLVGLVPGRRGATTPNTGSPAGKCPGLGWPRKNQLSVGSVSYPPVHPVAFSSCVSRAAIGATSERNRAGVALVVSSLTLAGDM